MIVFPDGRVALTISMTVEKRVVDSISGNPRATVCLEYFDSMAAQINDPNGREEYVEVSRCCDFTMQPVSFGMIEEWLSDRHPSFIGCRKVQ